MTPEEVLKWLRNKGYPWELAVGQMFGDAGWAVEHSRHFIDPITGKVRERDVTAYIVAPIALSTPVQTPQVQIHVSIECKSLLGKPWIVYAQEDADFPFLTDFLLGPSADLVGDVLGGGQDAVPVLDTFPRYAGLVQLKKEGTGKDHAFEATSQVSSAARAVGLASKKELLREQPELFPSLDVNLAVVALRGQLFRYDLDNSGKETVEEIAAATVPVRHEDGALQRVAIVTETGLPDFAKALFEQCFKLIDELVGPVDDWYQALRYAYKVNISPSDEGWSGVNAGPRYFAWDGPTLHSLEDRPPIPTPSEAIDAIEAAGHTASFGRRDRLRIHQARGAKQVYETDRTAWRRELLEVSDGNQILLIQESE